MGDQLVRPPANRTFSNPLNLERQLDEPPMKNISPLVLPTFRGKTVEDPNQFLFEFKILCQTYDYIIDNQKLKLFPSTLKESTLRWFIGLGSRTIRTWKQMETELLDKYQDYCRVRDRKEELFRMRQLEDKIMEDNVDRFQFVHQRCTDGLDNKISKKKFLRGIEDESRESLNLIGKGDINKLSLDDIVDICRNYSRTKVGTRNSRRDKAHTTDVSKVMEELANMKTNLLLHLNMQGDKKSTEPLSIYCSKCRGKHLLREFPLY